MEAAYELEADDAEAPAPLPPADPQQLVSLLKTLASQGSATDRAGITRLLEESQPILDYMDRQPAIESASAVLEVHRGEFIKLTQNPDALVQRAQALFAEERFAPLGFTAADIQRAFDRVGHPSFGLIPNDRTVELLRAAILHTADKSRRGEMAMALLMHLPDVVAEGRFLDGWIIQHCAFETTEAPDESNPFLFAMFGCGYDAWVAEKQTRDDAFARELGFDPVQLRNMTPAEIDACLAQMKDDPATLAKLEAFLNANPGGRAQANASLDAMEMDSVELLKREDAAPLLLTPEEIEPWLPIVSERLAAILEQVRPPGASEPPDPALAQKVTEELWPVLGEMAENIFTPKRIRQLIERIKACRDEWHAAGDKRIIGQALGAINQLERDDEPAENYFLKSLCFFSLRSVGRESGNAATEAGADRYRGADTPLG
jgi:hypothetical protein